MAYSHIERNDIVAEQVVKLLENLNAVATSKGLECTLTLAAASLLLGQTTDRARATLELKKPDGKALSSEDANGLVQQRGLPDHLGTAATAWLCSWTGHRPLRLTTAPPPFGSWTHVKSFQRDPAASDEQFELEVRRAGIELLGDMAKYKLLKIIRNAVAHGGVFWTTDSSPEQRTVGACKITGVLFASLVNPQKCKECDQILEQREDLKAGKARYELVHAPIGGFRDFVLDWARTLREARVSHEAVERCGMQMLEARNT